MVQAGAQNAEPISAVPLLAVIAQMENIAASPFSLLTPARILEFLAQLKNMLRYVGDMVGRYNALHEENGCLREENKKMERRLAKHENPHTPPSQARSAGNTKGTKKSDADVQKKQGGQPGNHGRTRTGLQVYSRVSGKL